MSEERYVRMSDGLVMTLPRFATKGYGFVNIEPEEALELAAKLVESTRRVVERQSLAKARLDVTLGSLHRLSKSVKAVKEFGIGEERGKE